MQTNRVAGLLDRVTQQQWDYREINQDVNNDDVLRKPRNWSGDGKPVKPKKPKK